MRIQKRERILLLILILVIGSYLFYNFVYLRNLETIAEKETVIEQKKQEAERILNALKLEKELLFEIQSLNFEVSNMTESYLERIDQENAIMFFNRYFDEYGLDVSNISFSEVGLMSVVYNPNPSATGLPQYPLRDLRDQYLGIITPPPAEAQEPVTASAESMTVSFGFEADYYDLLDFIDFMQQNKVEFVMSNLSMASSLEDSIVTGNTAVSIFSIPKLHEHEYMDWIWSDVIEYGRSNPFLLDDVVLDPYFTTKYDLTMVLGPMSQDIPTVNLGKFRDDTYQSYVYADSNIRETVEISIKLENGIYAYKYNTPLGTYPANYQNWVEFKPANDFLSMEVRSMVRESADDQSGVNLTIINETDLLFYINVFGDDPVRPRLNLETTENVVVQMN
ncbi:MAG: hypothetical protein Q8S24_09755 [Eubacteriales bacterium]|nr:hypothetical protein [Eubacteriales bacterium]